MIQKFEIPEGVDRNEMRDKFYGKIFSEIKKYNPALLGKIAVAGTSTKSPGSSDITSLYEVHYHSEWMNKFGSGRSLLQTIAATTITAKICDLVIKK